MRNRYHQKRQHKMEQKKRHMNTWSYGYARGYKSWKQFEAIFENNPRALKYWQDYQMSNSRDYAKSATNDKLRARDLLIEREVLKTLSEDLDDLEDAYSLSNAEYQKYFDYDWAVW